MHRLPARTNIPGGAYPRSRAPIRTYLPIQLRILPEDAAFVERQPPRRSEISTDITKIRVAVPVEEDLNFFGNQETPGIFDQAKRLAEQRFGSLSRVSYKLFTDINQLMFAGPLVAERDVAVGEFFDAYPTAGVDAVRQLVLKSRVMTAADAYKAHYRIIEARRQMQDFWLEHDVLLLPTVGTIYTVEQAMQDPFIPSFNNGYYTNFANPLGLSAISVPFDRTLSGVPYGVTFVAPAGGENFLSRLGQYFIETTQVN